MNKTEIMMMLHINKATSENVLGNRYNSYKYVDLGLPSKTMWAAKNIGAKSETGSGTFFQWGKTAASSTYKRSDYVHYEAEELNVPTKTQIDVYSPDVHLETEEKNVIRDIFNTTLVTFSSARNYTIKKYFKTKNFPSDSELKTLGIFHYNKNNKKIFFQVEGSTSITFTRYTYDIIDENKPDEVVLYPEDDAATAIMGGKWRMPTKEDVEELMENCNIIYIDGKGVRFVSKVNGNSIMIPLSGMMSNTSLTTTANGYISTSTLFEDSYEQYVLHVSGSTYLQHKVRFAGFPVRGVFKLDEDETIEPEELADISFTGNFKDLTGYLDYNSSMRINQLNFNSSYLLNLLHFSDIHLLNKEEITIEDISRWYRLYGTNIDDVICTGDVIFDSVNNYKGVIYDSDLSEGLYKGGQYFKSDFGKKALFVLGNHDLNYLSTNKNEDKIAGYYIRWMYFWADIYKGEGISGETYHVNDTDTQITSDIYDFIRKHPMTNLYNGIDPSNDYRYKVLEESKKTAYDKYFRLHTDDSNPEFYWDGVQIEENNTYWYKEYNFNAGNNNNPEKKILLIGLDAINRFDGELSRNLDEDSDSYKDFIKENGKLLKKTEGVAVKNTDLETWLYDLLNSHSGWNVIVMCHYPLDDYNPTDENTKIEGINNFNYCDSIRGVVGEGTDDNLVTTLSGDFNMRNRVFQGFLSETSSDSGCRRGNTNNIGDILDYFNSKEQNRINFVAWLSGHVHQNKFYYPENYPNLLCIAIDKASGLNRTNYPADRSDPNLNTCANYYSIDIERGLFKIVRLGLNIDKFLTPINYLVYDYKEKKIVRLG